MFTTSDYNVLARLVVFLDESTKGQTADKACFLLARILADQFKAENPKFNREHFLRKCKQDLPRKLKETSDE